MQSLVSFLQDAVAVAFVALGVVTAITWLRRRDRSLGFLALAIILLAVVSGLGRLQAYIPIMLPFLGVIELLGFMGTAYALLLYRNSVIPIPRRWHAVAIVSLAAVSVLIVGAVALSLNKTLLSLVAVLLVLVWCACVVEPIIRFWLAARGLPAVQAWRLRSLSLGFGGLVALLLFAVSAGLLIRQPVIQVITELVALAIIPLLYASFAPPSWLRRQWRAGEEEGLRTFMEDLLVSDDRDALANRALEWALRLAGGASGALFDGNGKATSCHGLDLAAVAELTGHLPSLREGVRRVTLEGVEVIAMSVPVKGLTTSGTLVILAGPFTPGFGGDEITRMQQLMSAFVTALDRRHLITQLEQSNAALEDANRHKSVFLANMSHELRTPLNAIIGFSELLTDAQDGQFDEATRKRFLSQILTSGRHLLGLINDILDLSRVPPGGLRARAQARRHRSRTRADQAIRAAPWWRRARGEPAQQGQRVHAQPSRPGRRAAGDRDHGGSRQERVGTHRPGGGGRPGGGRASDAPALGRRLPDRGGAHRQRGARTSSRAAARRDHPRHHPARGRRLGDHDAPEERRNDERHTHRRGERGRQSGAWARARGDRLFCQTRGHRGTDQAAQPLRFHAPLGQGLGQGAGGRR